ncbi:MAG: hypothetical protein A3C15_03400 [Candidatus Magasanikbacteria bacterium RIFCSPHIGHO2_02_FULL_50_9b]|uniref:Uncharacterized protein n=1 Tax=Candidatus Magasanikbacteria bacterium RIFCSPHIGHO2_02_FULL_50_9b TaxID=1798682 RepID=A0A1F6M914_9BACT|nr:MAG: hypothetical protein A3C15_03400 [Candidatus Magasanikbacteria bacterium RIFCSPHIGHO2_02_FULL_50_9b]
MSFVAGQGLAPYEHHPELVVDLHHFPPPVEHLLSSEIGVVDVVVFAYGQLSVHHGEPPYGEEHQILF